MPRAELPQRLKLALKACEAVIWKPFGDFNWAAIGIEYKEFGVTYRDLAVLAKRGYLTRTGRGQQVYYRLVRAKPGYMASETRGRRR